MAMPDLEGYTVLFSPSSIKSKIAKRKYIDARTQGAIAYSKNLWVLNELLSNPCLHPTVQERFVKRFESLYAFEFVSNRKSVRHKLDVKHQLMLIGRLASNPNLNPRLHDRIAHAAIRLDREVQSYMINRELGEFKTDVVLRLLREDMRRIAHNMVNNPSVENQSLRRTISEHFDIPLPEGSIWSSVKVQTASGNRTDMHNAISDGSIWSSVETYSL